MFKKFLPIGSVVLLKEGKKKIMICGRLQVSADTNRIYDYCGCLYPEGILKHDELILFQHDSIERVYFIGFQDQEGLEFDEYVTRKVEEKMEVMADGFAAEENYISKEDIAKVLKFQKNPSDASWMEE